MEEQFDAQAMMVKAGEIAKQVRKSEAYPAVIGGIAGGIAGALMAVLIAGRAASRAAEPAASEKKESRGWSLSDLVKLLTVGMSLMKQVQEWQKEQKKSE